MPFLSDDQQRDYELNLGQRGSLSAPTPEQAPEPGLAGAAFRRGNLFGTAYERLQNPKPDAPADPNFDPISNIPSGYEHVAPIFIHAQSAADMQWTKDQYDREQKDLEIIGTHHGYGVAATMAAGLVDPVTLASMAIPVGGETRLASIARSGLVTGAAATAQIAAQHAFEVSPTNLKTDALNVAGSAVLGGLLGGVLHGRVPEGRMTEMADRLNTELHGEGGERVLGPMDGRTRMMPETDIPKEMHDVPPMRSPEEQAEVEPGAQAAGERPGAEQVSDDTLLKAMESPAVQKAIPEAPISISEPANESEIYTNLSGEQSFGAAAAENPTLRGNSIAKGAGFVDSKIGFVSPASRVGRSPSLAARQVLQEMVNLPMTLTKNWEGVKTASPIERNIWLSEGTHWQGVDARLSQWKAYRARIAKEGGEQMNYGQFGQEISKAMRRGDAHEIPEVAHAAKDTRNLVFDPQKQRAIKNGLLPADVKPQFADSYLMRQYDHIQIRDNQTAWMKTLVDGFTKQGVDVAEARDLAYQVTRNVMGSERGTMDWKLMDGIVPKSGRFKERTLALPDKDLEPFLNSNIDQLSHSYLRSMVPENEFTERFGSRDMSDQISDIHDDYARLQEQAQTDGEKAQLSKRMDADLRDLTAMRDRLYGIYGQPKDPGHFAVRAGRLLRTFNASRLLGAATLAHFPDVANVMTRYGIPNTLAAMGKILTSGDAISLTRSSAKRIGVGLDMAMSGLAGQLGDYGVHSQFAEQRFAQKLMGRYTTFTGEVPLITMVQQLTSTMAQDEIIRSAQKVAGGGELGKGISARLASAGLDTDVLKAIADQHEQFGAKVNGMNFGMSEKWADQQLARVFDSAVAKEGHSVTLRPGAGDTPLFMSTEWGKSLRQFTTFGYAATRSVLNPLLQGLAHADPRAVEGLIALVGAGALSYVAKQTAAGQPIESPASPKFAAEVLDKSNLLGWTSEYLFPAAWGLGLDNLSRWSDRDPIETIGGPSAGTLAAIYKQRLPAKFLGSAESDLGIDDDAKGVNRADIHFMRRLMPGQNHWLLRNAINHTEDAIGDAFDLPGKSNADRKAEFAENQQ